MTVKEMYQMVMDLVGLDFMPEDSGIVYDNEKEEFSRPQYLTATLENLKVGSKVFVKNDIF